MASATKVQQKEPKTAPRPEQDKAEAKGPAKSTLREYFESICVAVILALFIRTFVVQAFKIPTGSMEENLLIGDHLLVNKMVYAPTAGALEKTLMPAREVRRGDVVVFKYPLEPERDFIKRVIGLPGDTLSIRHKTVYINGQPLQERYVFLPEGNGGEAFFDLRRDDMSEITIPDGHYFVMGDNRDNSHDSRFWGLLSRDLLKGRALIVYWSYDAPREEYLEEGLVERVKQLGSVLVHFVSRTRWDRFFHAVR
jgi:signal peptidase I